MPDRTPKYAKRLVHRVGETRLSRAYPGKQTYHLCLPYDQSPTLFFVLKEKALTEGQILVVDDEPQIRRVLHASLTAAGYDVVAAGSGGDAVVTLRTRKFDLVLLDMNMPDMDGLETCRAIRSTSDVPIIVLTVRDSDDTKIEALDAGADDYVIKPFNAHELMARIRAVMRRVPYTREANVEVITMDGIEINLVKRRLVVGGKYVRLTRKEFDLLHYLVSNPNIAMTHGKILQAVWGPDYGQHVEYLRLFVKQLRQKMEPEPANPRYILTEYGLGYSFHLPTEPKRARPLAKYPDES
jgi:two-component system KDP operon response regulator KdpE